MTPSSAAGSGRLRVVFFGTPQFAVPSLQALAAEAHVAVVVTQPDRPRGRGRVVEPPPVARAARDLGLPVMQPVRLRDPQVVERLRTAGADLHVTVAYGRIIPPEILALPPRGSINVHPSLLPRHRGASPIQAALLAGDAETGVTVLYQTPEMDAGDIILQRRVPIAPDDTARTLEARLAREAAEALVEAVRLIAAGTAPRRPQDPAAATYAGKLRKEDGRVEWTRPAVELARLVRAMDPWPSAFTWHRGRLLKIWRAQPVEASGPPGTVVEVRPGDGIVVACGQGGLLITEVQPEGRRRMTADEYVRGSRLAAGERLGEGAGALDEGNAGTRASPG
ncbi:MAG: methionyl-tRNA formyltransferase [Armatimonadota bacterium]|nr:methionyl-tRNA formyltransferase [Armatimonadota bacterium]MDR7436770.1 methionyl-tRNA formyltransferase [Armatimonadota bacterium]MDR7472717.1 methionyl-tRNA formyltransferase [Armatimonadota bacterium]MDR7506992.1 methionyl-tRNA formyltransferase [Armatimonadota bacterium]MDR7508853.1 methionyl-tRNA formyltransferase [Armatimonadota bacterium]